MQCLRNFKKRQVLPIAHQSCSPLYSPNVILPPVKKPKNPSNKTTQNPKTVPKEIGLDNSERENVHKLINVQFSPDGKTLPRQCRN